MHLSEAQVSLFARMARVQAEALGFLVVGRDTMPAEFARIIAEANDEAILVAFLAAQERQAAAAAPVPADEGVERASVWRAKGSDAFAAGTAYEALANDKPRVLKWLREGWAAARDKAVPEGQGQEQA
jgi:hypothetical protein